uniref:Uncharacterized protein n=1 Tax=Anguilla anguilla TaxID=7936 RepID=A0A0E9UAX7_ANGAN
MGAQLSSFRREGGSSTQSDQTACLSSPTEHDPTKI